uniref:ATP-dependent DNA helicase n=1 Tax=Aegilops tauschii subsp. strangulata TaxID=200361 RepID=A0A453BGH0_AEGTS
MWGDRLESLDAIYWGHRSHKPRFSGCSSFRYNVPSDDYEDNPDEDFGDNEMNATKSRKYVSAREYYAFKLQVRKKLFNIILFGGRLFQQWAVDMYIKIETMRLDWYSKPANQKVIRADLYQGLVDTVIAGESRSDRIGKRIVLPRTFPGGDHDMQRRFLDAMAIVQRWGKPDYFVTMTCNPYWEEITIELLPGQLPQDRPDLVARVYRAKQRSMMDLLIKGKHFGEVAAYVHVTEFQKRGLPHEHILLIMKAKSKLRTPDDYDRVISAEIPDKNKYPVLHDLVVKHMLHGPCGALKKSCPCMVDGQCRFHYPRDFCDATLQGKDSYPIYRRRDDGVRVRIRGADLDNRWVVPYNPFLLMTYNCHINVEACSSIKAVKYLFKYIYKGHDKASFAFEQDIINDGGIIDEIRQYRDARYISPPEAIYRIFGFKMFGVSPAVLQLQLHLPNMHTVAFQAYENLEDVVARPSSSKSMLTEYFGMNQKYPEARKLLYREFPEHYRWIAGNKKWQPRKYKRSQIGRLVHAHPAEGERYYLRVLLNHVRGATSFDDLKTVNGKACGSFKEVCEQLGLIEDDRTLDDCMTEATTFQMPTALRRLFATILVFYEATQIRQLWDKHLASMSEDYRRTQSNEAALEQMVLRDIRDLLQSMGKDIKLYGLPDLVDADGSSNFDNTEVTEKRQVKVDQEHLDLFSCLNNEQLAGFNDIMDHVTNQKSQIFFVDGPGGTGKTYLYKALLAKVRSMGLIAIATATSGIAASIMPGGRTAHSRFKIPIKLTDNSMCGFTKHSGMAELLKQASLIIWDEVAMTKRQAVETLDRSLQDIMECSLPFGGKVVVFGGDFRQVLPVVTRGTRAQITDATLLRSYLWQKIRKIRLTRNMRAQTDPWFSEYLLRIGNGTEETIGDDYVHLPEDIVIAYTDDDEPINKLIEDVFPSLHTNARSREYMSTRAILSTKNEHVDDLNDKMISRFPGEEKVYHSFDYIEDDFQNNYTIDFLNSITPNGLPPHVLRVKINCPVILLRNLDPHNGLCNGTRLMIRAFQDNAIDAEIIGGQHAGKRVFIPRIPMSPSKDTSLPFKLKRKQFPIRLSFAMTINKAQG